MTHHYRTRGTCSREISFDIEDGVVHNVHFQGGCNGNTQGVSLLVEGMPAAEVVKRPAPTSWQRRSQRRFRRKTDRLVF